ncbi:hypothetical protein JQ596_21635 [Bradyrhizobium manausense]|uniref:hypothetical protein n=1 Tax=Bradyrhizobium TaxID=374 RepID=UPI001BAA5437|nr:MULTISPECIES: hypothetical protein [Bradyrhizobium]MBR0828142.1 hypothetical protein [Bradyrhizobium manausense]UVO32997.1 hypothetical protein KUF59_21440 [Bradyrhizobium arachidis]
MNEEQRKLCRGLIMSPRGSREISKETFLQRFPSAVDDGGLALKWLDEAYRARHAKDLDCSLIVGFVFGFTPEHVVILCRLVDADWHHSHEDVVSALDELRTPAAAEALFRATRWVPKYLEFDDSRALASKAIWALGKLAGGEAESKLAILAASDDEFLRNAALKQIERRRRSVVR